jgi:hypothetical protein
VKRTLISGLVGMASGVSAALAGAHWWVLLLGLLAVLVVLLAVGLVFLTAVSMMLQQIQELVRTAYPGSFKGLWGIELKASSEPRSQEPAPPKPNHSGRGKPPST